MEKCKQNNAANEDCPEELPSLIRAISAHGVADFDSVSEPYCGHGQLKSTGFRPLRTSVFGIEAAAMEGQNIASKPEKMHSVSISMPPSPIGDHIHKTKRVLFRDDDMIPGREIPSSSDVHEDVSSGTRQTKFYSQPLPKGSALNEAIAGGKSPNLPVRNPRIEKLKDKRFDSFKTWSGKLERQLSNLRGKHHENGQEPQTERHVDKETIPVDRYFDALDGPELDTLRASEEEILLPDDKTWPFLLRFPISSFGICLGISSQAIMWKALASSESTKFLHVTPDINLVLWFISIALMAIVTLVYTLKIIFYFEAVRREYYHPIRVNFFFAPWIALLFLFLGIPPSVTQTLHSSVWYILMTPIFFLELKIYGQWMSGGQRRLSRVANPSNHLSIVGNFVGALLGASMGLKEGPIFFFAVGLAHYIVLFVTLYQRLPTNKTLPKELHPVFFLFVAAPSVASMAWARIEGSFDHGSRIAYFIALFLYFSLAVRVNFFRGFRFSLAWWAYTFPMTGAAVATIRYSTAVTSTVTKTLTVALCIVATLTVAALLVITIIHAFVLRDLFPNDIAIAISERRPKTSLRWYHRRSGSADVNIQQFLKYSDPDDKDIEASANPPSGEAIHAI
ncbi:S-type anion channel SLAH2-like [Henckelia pumila]|uniref:S-type anion channel SLAH2-like n=1 Tax=Henckelia pumila TaxID=405737 RepID=UPI003C6E2E0A